MSSEAFRIEIAAAEDDVFVGVQPPVDAAFRESMYGEFERNGLLMEAASRDTFFKQAYSGDRPYSELRLSLLALEVHGVRLIELAHASAEALEKQGKRAHVSPFLRRQLFGDR